VQFEQLLRREGNDNLWPEQKGVPDGHLHIKYNDGFKTGFNNRPTVILTNLGEKIESILVRIPPHPNHECLVF
jgi:hypothetical protein